MKAIVSGYFGFGNIGDEVIRAVLERELPNIGIEPIILAKEPTKENEIKRTNFIEIFKTLKEAYLLISGGGGLLQDKTSSRSLYYYLSLIYLPKLVRKKSVVLAQGIGPINKDFNKKIVKNILNKVDLLTVRDKESKDLLQQLGIKKEIYVTQDLAFMYEPKNLTAFEQSEQYNVFQIKGGEDIDIEEFADIARFMHYKTDLETILVPFYKNVDLEIAKRIEEKTKFRVVVPKDIDEAYTILKAAKLVVGMRYHSVVFSLMLKKPILPICYDDKVRNISNLFEIEAIDIKEAKLSYFSKLFSNFIQNQEDFGKKIETKLKQAKEDAKRNFELLLQLSH